MQNMSFIQTEDYQELIEDIVRDGRLYASENHQEILKVSMYPRGPWQSPTGLAKHHQGRVSSCYLSDTEPALG